MATAKEIKNFIFSSKADVLKNAANRNKFAISLQQITNYWDSAEIRSFINEMRGLDFYRYEDRVIFCDLFFSWYLEDGYESSNS